MMNRQALLQMWQKRLALGEWRIVLKPDCHPQDFRMADMCGEVEFTESDKTAVIRIMDEKHYGDRIVPYSFEKTLVYELLHLKLCLLHNTGDDLQDRFVHQLIDDLARALTDRKEEQLCLDLSEGMASR